MARAAWRTRIVVKGVKVLTGWQEIFEDFIDDLLLQIRVATDAEAVSQCKHQRLLHLEGHSKCL